MSVALAYQLLVIMLSWLAAAAPVLLSWDSGAEAGVGRRLAERE
jgi:hypothetical protein